MANTLHRVDSRGSVPSITRLLGDLYDISPEVASGLRSFGKLGYTLAYMVSQKAKRAANDKKGKNIRTQIDGLQDTISEKVKPVMSAMSSAIPEGQSVDLDSFRLLAANMVCQQELAEVIVLQQRLNALALAWKDTTIAEAITTLMGNETGQADWPVPNTVYIVCDKDMQWTRLAFSFENGNVPSAIYVQNGDSWDTLDCDLSNPYVEKFFTSKRTLLKFAFVQNFLPERLPSMLRDASDNYNPIGSITPKTMGYVEEVAMEDWLG